ncbi:11243_t:CDS:1, partial [Paraglomus occultum]
MIENIFSIPQVSSHDIPRQTTVKACGSVRLITLKRDAFRRLLSQRR